jgi:tetratricopeptide (TPR) repeat protein
MGEKFYDKAIAALEDAQKIEPKNARLYVDEGDVRVASGKPDDGIENYQEALAILGKDIVKDENSDVAKKLGYTVGMGKTLNPEQRDKLWVLMWKSCPDHPSLWSDVAVSYRDGGNGLPKDSRKALEWYLRAVAVAPEDAAIQNDTGVIYDYNLEQPDKGEPYYRKAVEIGKREGYDWNSAKSPQIGYRDSINNLAKLLEKQKRWKDLKEFAENDVPEEHPDRTRWIREAEAKKADKVEDKKK